MLYRGVGDDRISNIGQHSPNVAHPSAKLLRTACARNNIPFAGVEPSNECSDTRSYSEALGLGYAPSLSYHTSNMIYGNSKLV